MNAHEFPPQDPSPFAGLDEATEPLDPLRLARMDWNDKGLAERLRARFGTHMIYTAEIGWVVFDEKIWRAGHRGEQHARRLAHETVEAMQSELQALADEYVRSDSSIDSPEVKTARALKQLAPFRKFITDAGNASKTAAMLKQAEVLLSGSMGEFDPDRFRFAAENGSVEIDWHDGPCLTLAAAGGIFDYIPLERFAAGPATLASLKVERLPDSVWLVGDDTFDEAELVRGVEVRMGPGAVAGRVALQDYVCASRLVVHNPAHRVTRMIGTAFDPAATCPEFEKNLKACLPDAAARDWLQVALGSALTGITDHQCIVCLQGKGADGKSTIMRVILKVLGSYAQTCDPRALLDMKPRSAAEASPDVASWAGDTRLLYAEEPPRNAFLNEALLKQITGGPPIRARHLRRDEFEFEPRFTLLIAFNEMIRVRGGDAGLWRRIRLLRFPRSFSAIEQAKAGDVYAKLIAEAPGILNWLIEGMAKFRRAGCRLETPEWMQKDINSYRASSNPVADWVDTRCERIAGHIETFAALYADFKAFLQGRGATEREIPSSKAFALTLTGLQIYEDRDGSARKRIGLRLLPASDGA